VTTKPFSVLSEPLMQDRESRRRIRLHKRAMEKALTLGELRRSLGLSQRAVAQRLQQSQANISRLEREDDPQLSTLTAYVESLGGRLTMHATFDDQDVPLLIKH
jgi:DNA-binding XRE family transcriptional regulator